jgi:hypothetical protein
VSAWAIPLIAVKPRTVTPAVVASLVRFRIEDLSRSNGGEQSGRPAEGDRGRRQRLLGETAILIPGGRAPASACPTASD